jgi:hypothetical protein
MIKTERSKFSLIMTVAAVAAGLVLRLSYPLDIEFKADERWTFEQVRAALSGGSWLWSGMPTSIGGLNPGASLWVFIPLGWLFGADTPPQLARGVQCMNSAALIALVLFALRSVRENDREPWFWAAALWAVNPVAVILERKIWPPSVLPLFTVAIIAAWWGRRGNIGSFLFALLSVLAAQIHLSVAFFAAALAIWSLADDRQSLRIMPFVAGAALGLLPAVPWILEWTGGLSSTRRLPIFHFWPKWLTQPFGFGSDYTLGAAQFGEFLTMPILGGTRTYLVALLHVWLAALAIYLYWRAGRSILMLGPPSLRTVILGSGSAGLLVHSTLIGYGILLTLLTIRGAGLHRHYLVVAAPIMALWVARLALFADGGLLRATGRLALAGLCVGGALVSASLLHFIHAKQIIGAEFGATWAAQQSGLAPLAPTLVIPARRQLP